MFNPRNDAAALYAQGLINADEYYQRDQVRIKEIHAAARGLNGSGFFSGYNAHPIQGQHSPDGRNIYAEMNGYYKRLGHGDTE